MSKFERMYKILCVSCDWFVFENTAEGLYGKYGQCPKCRGATDAIKDGI